MVPEPCFDLISTWPPISWMLRFTTSMPTPRPETSVTCSAVEKPGAKISMPTSSSVMFSLTAIPWEMAFARMRSRFRPAPSSVTSIQMFPPWCSADRIRFPTGDFPAATRFSGSSIPWSRLLRTRCVKGSIMRSIRLLSSSVELPISVSSICLLSLPARSRTRRGKRLKTYSIGIIRMDITDSCRSRALRCSWPMLVIRSPWFTGSSSLERWASIDWVITSSPTRLIS